MYKNRVQSRRNKHHVLWQLDNFAAAADGSSRQAMRYRCAPRMLIRSVSISVEGAQNSGGRILRTFDRTPKIFTGGRFERSLNKE
jgi:hypothetical protein